MKQLIIKLDFDEQGEKIVDNFVMNLSHFLKEFYPELKFPDKPWEIINKD